METMDDAARNRFVDEVTRIVVKRFPLATVSPGDTEFSLCINGQLVRLENLYRLVSQYPDDRQHQIERWVVELIRAAEGASEQAMRFDDIKERVLPMVMSDAPRDVSGPPMVTQELVPGLIVAYALDSDRTIAYIPRHVFDAWDVELDLLHETAIDNLARRSEALAAHAAQDEQTGEINMILIQTMDGYDASRILLPGLHDRLREYLGSPFLAAVPNRDILVCCRIDSTTRHRMQQQAQEDFRTMPHQVSAHLYLVTPDGIAPFEEEL